MVPQIIGQGSSSIFKNGTGSEPVQNFLYLYKMIKIKLINVYFLYLLYVYFYLGTGFSKKGTG
jgi:hypothetical protein